MEWFRSKGSVFHAADNIDCPAEHLKRLLKLFSMFKTRVIPDEPIDNRDFPEAVGLMCINCRKVLVVH